MHKNGEVAAGRAFAHECDGVGLEEVVCALCGDDKKGWDVADWDDCMLVMHSMMDIGGMGNSLHEAVLDFEMAAVLTLV